MATATLVPEVKTKKNILENADVLTVSKGLPSRAKTIGSSELGMNTSADVGWLHHQKQLLDCQELKKIVGLDAQIDLFVKNHALPFIPLQKGFYILPVALFDTVENKLMEFKAERNKLIDDFIAVYDDAVLAAKDRLGNLFNAADYKTKEAVRQAFKFSWNYLQFGVSEKLNACNKEIVERKHAEYKAEIQEASQAIQQMLRTNMSTLVSHLADRLAIGDNGKKKVFRTSAIESLNEFFATFPARNLTDDVQLEALVNKAKALTNGLSPDEIRTNDSLRESLQTQFASIQEDLNKLVIDQPLRGLSLEE
jgi:hypothetical protein